MIFPNGSEAIPGWRVRFPVKQAENAETYRVVDDRGNPAFLKVFDPARIPEDRFDSEGQLIEVAVSGSLSHPGIPAFKASGVLGPVKRPYLLAELVPGETLDHHLARKFALAPAFALFLMRELLATVAHLHALDDPVVHNELTPSNVVLDARDGRDERPVVIDFGHARRASDGQATHPSAADPYYLPNECFHGASSSEATDVFALGATFYRVLFGTPPWHPGVGTRRRDDVRQALAEARIGPLPVPAHTVGGELHPASLTAIKKALSLRPDDRFTDAGSFLEALAEGTQTKTPDARTSPHRPLKPLAPAQRGFAAVGGMETLKRTLTLDVIDALREPEKYERLRVPIPNGLLLYGPPGCGKTFIAGRFGEELGIAFRKVTPGMVASRYIHGTQEKITQLFDEARAAAPCVVFLDEVEALMPSRGGDLYHGYAAEVTEWLTQIGGCGEAGVFLLAATNQPHRIDPAVLRAGRFDKVVYVGPPDHAARKAMFQIHLSQRPVDGSVDLDELARLTKGRVSSDIKFLVDEAARSTLAANQETIVRERLVEAIDGNGPSVGTEEIARYERMREQFEPERSGRQSGRRIIRGFASQGDTPS